MLHTFWHKALPRTSLIFVGVGLSVCAHALEPAHIQMGPLNLTPTLATEVSHWDNLFRDDSERDTWRTELAPALQAWMQNGSNTYSVKYELTDYRYASSHDDDFTDHTLNLDIHHEFNARNELNIFGEWYDGHEQRGTGLSEGIGELFDEPIEYDSASLGGNYTYGGTTSRGRLRLSAETVTYDYQNFEALTAFRDRDRDTYSATLFWQVAPRTDVLLETRYIDNQYDKVNPADPGGSLDSEEWNYFLGLAWEVTARTSGSLRLGLYDREYDSGQRGSSDGFTWQADVTWRPKTYSIWELESRRFSRETTGLGDFIDTEQHSLNWNYDWTGRSSTQVYLLYASDEFSGSDRDDDRLNLELSYKYEARRWLDLGVGYRREDRDSTIAQFDYDLNVYFVEVELSL
jgi:hypothetical protein